MVTDLKQLLVETHRGHEPAARVLWNTQAPRLLHYARAILPHAADAEDVLQSVFCRILQLPGREVERVADVGAWLAQVVRRESINHIRATRRESARREAAGELRLNGSMHGGVARPDPELEDAIESLPRRLREVVVLKHVAGLTFDQIAHATGLNRNTGAARYRAAMERLRVHLSPEAASSAVRSVASTRPAFQEARHAG